MAYEKQTWNTGDVITAEKLNHIEDGINAILPFYVVNFTEGEMKPSGTPIYCDKTPEEIVEMSRTKPVIGVSSVGSNGVLPHDILYCVTAYNNEERIVIEFDSMVTGFWNGSDNGQQYSISYDSTDLNDWNSTGL